MTIHEFRNRAIDAIEDNRPITLTMEEATVLARRLLHLVWAADAIRAEWSDNKGNVTDATMDELWKRAEEAR